MPDYSRGTRRWIAPLLALHVGGNVIVRFLSPSTDAEAELGILPAGDEMFIDFPAPGSHVRELTQEELATFAGQFRQGAREVMLSDEFGMEIAAARELEGVKTVWEAAAGVVIDGQICRIRSFRSMDFGAEVTAWKLLCDAPLEAG